ncbi:MAG TPA: GNAT family N-acetyltransferase [Hyphomicrobiales bacterium]|nr:GNAT family N-acetyltransferase [Hyphomicrobiales bacterium]
MTVTHLFGGTVRKQWFTEKDKFRDHLLRLDPESRRMRFGMNVADEFIRRYAEQTSQFQSVIYGFFVGREMSAAAELRMIGTSWHGEAEAAFSVERKYQDSGVGTELLGKIIVASRNRGVERLYMNCLSENRRMQSVARKYEAELYFDHGEVIGKLAPAYPTPLSLWSEALDNSNGFVMAVLEAPLQQFKPAA